MLSAEVAERLVSDDGGTFSLPLGFRAEQYLNFVIDRLAAIRSAAAYAELCAAGNAIAARVLRCV